MTACSATSVGERTHCIILCLREITLQHTEGLEDTSQYPKGGGNASQHSAEGKAALTGCGGWWWAASSTGWTRTASSCGGRGHWSTFFAVTASAAACAWERTHSIILDLERNPSQRLGGRRGPITACTVSWIFIFILSVLIFILSVVQTFIADFFLI
jgi:hypothetical protein